MNDTGVDHDAEAIGQLVMRIRGRNVAAGGDWDWPGIRRGVGAAVQHGRDYSRPVEAVALACIRAAADRRNRTPAVMGMPGPHWQHDTAVAEAKRPPRGDEECPQHDGQWAGDCSGCQVEQYGDEPVDVIELEQQGLTGKALYAAVRPPSRQTGKERGE